MPGLAVVPAWPNLPPWLAATLAVSSLCAASAVVYLIAAKAVGRLDRIERERRKAGDSDESRTAIVFRATGAPARAKPRRAARTKPKAARPATDSTDPRALDPPPAA